MRGALTLNQSEIDKSKPTNLKSVSIFSFQREIINMAYFTLPFSCEYVGAYALDVLLPRNPCPRQ